MDYQVNEEALAVRKAREAIHREANRAKARAVAKNRADALIKMAGKIKALSNQARGLGEPDLAEDLRTCAKFAVKFAEKAAK